MIKSMVVDDQALLKETLVFLLNQSPDIEALDGGLNGEEAIANCRKYRPDLVLMDIRMPILDGISAMERIKKEMPRTKVLILTTFEDDDSIYEALERGADGYLVKDIAPAALILAVKSAYNDLYVMHKSVLNTMREKGFMMKRQQEPDRNLSKNLDLNESEAELIRLLVDGMNNKEIGEIMSFTEGTIKNKVSRLLDKLELKDRTQIVVYAIKNNLI